jgi:hypothetical protein
MNDNNKNEQQKRSNIRQFLPFWVKELLALKDEGIEPLPIR